METTQTNQDAASFAKNFLENVLSFFGLNTDIKVTQNEDVINLLVPSTHLNGFLIGQHGETLRALQYLVGNTLRNQNFEQSRVSVDVADYKQHRAERLAEKSKEWIEDVKSSQKAKHLQPMNAADRRVIHQTVSDISGVESQSEGEARDRHIVISPAAKGEETTPSDE